MTTTMTSQVYSTRDSREIIQYLINWNSDAYAKATHRGSDLAFIF